MKIAFCYNVKKNKPSADPGKQDDTEFDGPEVVNGIKNTLKSLGHSVIAIEADENAFIKLKKHRKEIDLVFNIAEGLGGDARESQIPLFCEVLGIAYTHSSPTVHAIKLDKEFTKYLLEGAELVKVPGRSKFPLIVKPNKEGSSKGIMDANVVYNKKELEKRISVISKSIGGEILVEEYIDGREFTVSVIGNEDPIVLPIVEQKFDFLPKGMNKMASYELKWLYEDKLENLKDAYDCPAKISKKLQKKIEDTSVAIYKFLGVRDCARIDYRLDKKGDLYFLEINTLPGMIPDENVISYFPLSARTAGMSYKDLVGKIIEFASKRYGLKTN